jgi:CheY-like chemotaxis protein
MNGLEFLKVIKADNALKKTPIVVLTTTREQQNAAESFKPGIAFYIIKPVDYKKFFDAIIII